MTFPQILCGLAIGSMGFASVIGPGAFTGAAVTEGFEGVTNTPNSPQSLGTGFFAIGALSTYTFGSGLQFTSPVPNPEHPIIGGGGPVIGDFSVGFAAFGCCGGGINAALGGSAYFGEDSNGGAWTFVLPVTALQVGVFYASNAPITMSVFNSTHTLLDSLTLPASTAANWSTAFLGLQDPGITSVTFSTTSFAVLDNLEFQVPEPSSAGLAFAGLSALLIVARCLSR
jgi:hypothetical protein